MPCQITKSKFLNSLKNKFKLRRPRIVSYLQLELGLFSLVEVPDLDGLVEPDGDDDVAGQRVELDDLHLVSVRGEVGVRGVDLVGQTAY